MRDQLFIGMAAACCLMSAAHAGVFEDAAKSRLSGPPKADPVDVYMLHKKSGTLTPDEVLEYEMTSRFRVDDALVLLSMPYYKDLVSHFYGVHIPVEWTPGLAAVVKHQTFACKTAWTVYNDELAKLSEAVGSAPIGQWGTRVYPMAQQQRLDSARLTADYKCLLLNVIQKDLEANFREIKGGF